MSDSDELDSNGLDSNGLDSSVPLPSRVELLTSYVPLEFEDVSWTIKLSMLSSFSAVELTSLSVLDVL